MKLMKLVTELQFHPIKIIANMAITVTEFIYHISPDAKYNLDIYFPQSNHASCPLWNYSVDSRHPAEVCDVFPGDLTDFWAPSAL
jgi:hypothetical protein